MSRNEKVDADAVGMSHVLTRNTGPAQRLMPLMLAVTLSACASLAPDYAAPELEMPGDAEQQAASAAPSHEQGTVETAPAPWWRTGGDTVLTALIDEALAHNYDLLIAASRIEQARAAFGLSRSAQWPDISAQASASRGRDPSLSSQIAERASVQLAVSYELDFWGKYRDASAAAREQLISAEAGRAALRLSLISQVAQGWYGLQAAAQNVLLAEQTLAAQSRELALLERRAEAGLVSAFDLRQQEAAVAGTRVALALRISAREQTRNALALLLGRTPKAQVESALPESSELLAWPVPDALPDQLPSSRLLQQPDVLAAEAELKAANYRIGVARSAWFPSLSLTAAGGVASNDFSSLFDGGARAFSITGGLLQPLFNAGRISAGVDSANAGRDAAELSYRRTLAVAFREVLDALQARQSAVAVLEAEAVRVAALTETLRIARLRYGSGLIGQFEVLGTERQLFAAQGVLIDARRAEAAAAVQLWTSLGG